MRQRLALLPVVIRVLVLICIITALARPQTGRVKVNDISKGIAIEMVVDRSGSMKSEMEYRGKKMTRLDVVKQVFMSFALGNGKDLPGRPNDLIGMISFARYPDTNCPLTLAHGALKPFLDSVSLIQTREENCTAIGDAIALAAARLKTVDDTLAKQRLEASGRYEIKSKIIILLSDGENNCGKRDPIQAAEKAAEWGIKIYTIAIGGSESVSSLNTLMGIFKMADTRKVDFSVLEKIADKTGGFFKKAEDGESLSAIYKEIDVMEKSEIESIRYIDYTESFIPFAIAGLILIFLEVLLTNTAFRKIP